MAALPAPGFTLIEVVISAALMALIVASGYLCLNAAVSSQKLIEPRVEIIQNARVAMALVSADLRAACPLSKDFQFLGMHRTLEDTEADNLDFATHNYTPRRSREGDFCEVSIYLDKNPETGQFSLWRRRNPTLALDPLSGGSREELATGLLGARFKYFDGLDWYDTWGEIKGVKEATSQKTQLNLSGMPDAVRITLMFDSNPRSKTAGTTGEPKVGPPLVFQTVTRLNLAHSPERSTGNDSSGSSSPGGSAGGAVPGVQRGGE